MTAPAAVTGEFAPAGPPRGPRPATVSIGAAFQAVAVVLLLLVIALAWIVRFQYDGLAEEAARLVSPRPGELEAEYNSNMIMAIVVTVLAGAAALWFGTTVWPLFRGANVARILAAVGAFALPGLGLILVIGSCLSGAFLLFFLVGAPIEDDPGLTEDYPEDFDEDFYESPFQEKLWDLQSSTGFDWAGLIPLVLLLIVAALAVAAIMYVLPPTNRWYNPARAAARGRPYPVPVYYPVYYPYPGPPPVGAMPPLAPPQPPAAPPTATPPVEPPAEPPQS